MGDMRVLIADDHPLFRMGLAYALAGEGFEIVAEVPSGEMAIYRCRQGGLDIAVLDVRMPGVDGITACQVITALDDPPVVAILTTFEEPAIVAAARDAGAHAYLSKETDATELARILRKLVEDPSRRYLPRVDLPDLTPREGEVLQLLARGMATKEIASHLGLSPETIKDYVQAVYRKLEVHDRVSAARRAAELGLV